MARIPVARGPVVERRDEEHDRRGGLPLWLWPLIPLLLGALALGWSLTGDDQQRGQTNAQPDTAAGNNAGADAQGDTATGAEGANTGAQAGAGDVLTDMMTVVNERNQRSLAGRQALFANVAVQSVVGDRGFWIGPSPEEQLFVVMDEANVGQAEGAVQITPGQTVTLGGTLERLPSPDQTPPEWGFDAGSQGALEGQEVYLQARQVIPGQ